MRKAALVLGQVERALMAEAEPQGRQGPLGRYAADLAALFVGESPGAEAEGPAAVAEAARALAGEDNDLLRAVDRLRHALMAATGQAPADWDLIDPRTGLAEPSARQVHAGMKAYLEDLRSPFNVGTIFRTAEAFGLEELVLSPGTADPRHPRAERSAMGTVDILPWRRASLDALAADDKNPSMPIFALELGGVRIDRFDFPARGIVVVGSEELGLSRESRELCSYGVVSIPMSGAKASLNVAVAFGILMHEWTRALAESER